MSLSSCPECWNSPCTCGHEYESWSKERLLEQINVLQKVLKKKEEPKMGLYRIYWKSGGNSLAAIGRDKLGELWIAPTNWVSGSSNFNSADIEKLELLFKNGT